MGESPLKLIAGMIDNYWAQQMDNRAVATLVGIRNFDQANGKGRHLDHEFMPIEEAKYPPYHFNCRSSFILVFEGMREPIKRASTNGTVDNVSYYEWLKQQTNEFQDEVLGKTKAKLFRDGGLSVERFKALQLDKNFTSMPFEKMKQFCH